MDTSNLSLWRYPHLALTGWLRARWAPSSAKGDWGDLMKVMIALLVTLGALLAPLYDVLSALTGLPALEVPGPAAPAAMTGGVTDVLSAENSRSEELAES